MGNDIQKSVKLRYKQDEIEFLETKLSTGTQNPYENLEQRCEKKISKILLGHADALDSTPGKLGSGQDGDESPVAKALSNIQVKDTRFVATVVNNSLIPKLKALGIPIPDGWVFGFSNDDEVMAARRKEDANNKATADVVVALTQAGFEVAPEYIVERTGIPVTKKATPIDNQPVFSEQVTNTLHNLYGTHPSY